MYGYEARFLPEELSTVQALEPIAPRDDFEDLLWQLAEHYTGRIGSEAVFTREEMDKLFMDMLNAQKADLKIKQEGYSYESQAAVDQGEHAKLVVTETMARWGRRLGLTSMGYAHSSDTSSTLGKGGLLALSRMSSPYADKEDRIQSGIMGVLEAIPRYLRRFQIAVEEGTLKDLAAFSTVVTFASREMIYKHINSEFIRELLGIRLRRRQLEAITAAQEKYEVPHISLIRREQLASKKEHDHILKLQDLVEATRHVPLGDMSFPNAAPEEGYEQEGETWEPLSVEEVYPDRNWQTGFNLVDDMLAREQTVQALESASLLTERELAVLALRGGLSVPGFAAGGYTLAEVGLLLGTDSSSIYASETKAVKKLLRSPSRVKALADSLHAVAADTVADRAFTGDRLRTGRITTPKDGYWRRADSVAAETDEHPPKDTSKIEPAHAKPAPKVVVPKAASPLRPELLRPAERSEDQAPPLWTRYLQDVDTSRGPVRPKTQSYELVYKTLKAAVLDDVGHLGEGVHPSHPARLYEELSRYLSPYLTVQHLETFWNREVPRLIGDRRLDKSVAVDTNHLGRLVSRLLADHLADGDTVKLVVPEGAEGRCSYLGAWANRGTIIVVGEAGDYTGAYIGGTAVVLVEGDVGDYAGAQAHGESYLVVDGIAGGHTGEGAYGLSTVAIQEAAEAPIASGISDEASVVVATREWLPSTGDTGRPISGGEQVAEQSEQPKAPAQKESEEPEVEEEPEPEEPPEEPEPELEPDLEEKAETAIAPMPEEPPKLPTPEPGFDPSIAEEPEETIVAGMVVETSVSKPQATAEQTLEFDDAASWLGVSTDQLQSLATQIGHEGRTPLTMSQFLTIQHRLADDDDHDPPSDSSTA